MGWWKVQGTDDLVGDEPFSLLRNAAMAVAEAYYGQCARAPTRSEWERLFREAVQPIRDLESTSTQPLIADAAVGPSAVHIALELKGAESPK